MEKRWWVYIIQTEKGTLYTGLTTDLERRFKEHTEGKKGAKFFSTSSPVTIMYKKRFPDRSTASRYEAAVKKLKRDEKLKLIEKKLTIQLSRK
jgi:putative endonuclease